MPFPVNLGESYSVRFQLSMDFVRQINPFPRATNAASPEGTATPASCRFAFGHPYIQTKITKRFDECIEKCFKQGLFRLQRAQCMECNARWATSIESRQARRTTRSSGDERDATGFFAGSSPSGRFAAVTGSEQPTPAPRHEVGRDGISPPRRRRRARRARPLHRRRPASLPQMAVHLRRWRDTSRTPETTTAAQGGRRRSGQETRRLSGPRSRPVPRRRWRRADGPARRGR